jgi:phosphoenolpyruvate carboxylase
MDELLINFHDNVALKYSLYNSLFLTLPFQKMQEVGTLLTLFTKHCAREIQQGKDPSEIVDSFFSKNLNHILATEKNSVLFTMLQFVERQIVLFDALEDAAYTTTHHLDGPGTLHNLINKVVNSGHEAAFIRQIQDYRVKIVLTAHPTQFYPYPVLGIITQLTAAIQGNHLKEISDLLWQMGKTSFKHQHKPTPYEEAHSLVWYIENIFYRVIPQIHQQLNTALRQFRHSEPLTHPVVELGFWPGGDRDGNPNVDSETTLAVARLLKARVLKMYAEDLHELGKRLTFKGVLENCYLIRQKIENTRISMDQKKPAAEIYQTATALLDDLMQLRHTLIVDHDSLFLEKLEPLITKVHCFGFYLAAMDMRENAPVHRQVFRRLLDDLKNEKFKNYYQLNSRERTAILRELIKSRCRYTLPVQPVDPQFMRTIQSIATIKPVQTANGENSLCRYIISNSQSALDVLELLTMLHLAGNFSRKISVDIVPLFESIKDLENSPAIMQELYQCDFYRAHLSNRHDVQTIMLGFSDGTKDGGYVAANWSIYKAKLNLSEISAQQGIKVIFFDGRGGPPARGGGNTHNFYRSLGSKISHRDLQLTIQGQTVSSNFGTEPSAKFNIEQLFTAGIDDLIFPESANDLSTANMEILQQLANESQKIYMSLKEDPLFVPYLEEMTPLRFYGELNIGSRPTARKKTARLEFADLRAIPFVGSWSQLKQNIPGYFGFGSALQKLINDGKEAQLIQLYQQSLFFRTLVENTMMSLCKTFFPLTAYMRKDKKFGKFWQRLHDEAKLTQILLEKISGQNSLLEKDPLNRESIRMREEIVLPLLIIQQFAMTELKKLGDKNPALAAAYKEMILKALAANTNASRNAA